MREETEKAEKSPLVVIATMMFLAMFIIVPPLLRTYMPKEDDGVSVVIVKKSLYCEKIAVKEKISHSVDGLWKTNLLVYDMTTGQMRDLSVFLFLIISFLTWFPL